VSHSIADVFREAGKRHVAAGAKRLAAFIESLPTDEDYSRFTDAGRDFLSFDGEIQNLPAGRRRTARQVEGSEFVTALWEAARRVLKENPPSEKQHSDFDFRLFGTRLLMARLIIGGLRGASDKKALMEAALLLRGLSEDAKAIRSKSEAKKARHEKLTENSAQHAQRVQFLKTEAEKLLKTEAEKPRNLRLRKSDRARQLNKRMGAYTWPTHNALIAFARRNRIKI
jgi:hypothetical protein